MNGRVRPVVGMRLRVTAMCMRAVTPTAAVSPVARYWPNGSSAVRAIRNPSQQNTPNSSTHQQQPQEPPLLPDGAEDEVGVGVGQIAEFLLALSEADAEDAARSDADERLMDLARGLGAIEEFVEPISAVPRELNQLQPADDGTPVPSSRKCPILAPAVNSTMPPSRATSTAMDMLGCSRISSEVKPRIQHERAPRPS